MGSRPSRVFTGGWTEKKVEPSGVAAAGWLWFGESLDSYTVIGAAIILGSNAYIAHREAVLARRRASAAATAGAVPGE